MPKPLSILQDLKERFINLRTMEGGLYLIAGAALIALEIFDVTKIVAAGLLCFGMWKTFTKKSL